jgi:ABC-2 type transport system ATP-binding protein
VSFAIRGATVLFGDVVALDDVTVAMPEASVVAVVGGDGAGKSTLLRALVREVALDAGTLDTPPNDRQGYMPAGSGSWASLTARENLDFVGGIYGVHGDELVARRTALLERAGLTDASDRLASKLSGGMRRKLGFCMAMLHSPALLVLDEPSTGVDPVSRVELWRLVAEAAAGGAAVIVSTTYLDEAERASRLVALDEGRVLVQGSYDDVRRGFRGVVTESSEPVRPEWSWRRGRTRREFWPDADAPTGRAVVDPDLEDIVIALSLARRAAVRA